MKKVEKYGFTKELEEFLKKGLTVRPFDVFAEPIFYTGDEILEILFENPKITPQKLNDFFEIFTEKFFIAILINYLLSKYYDMETKYNILEENITTENVVKMVEADVDTILKMSRPECMSARKTAFKHHCKIVKFNMGHRYLGCDFNYLYYEMFRENSNLYRIQKILNKAKYLLTDNKVNFSISLNRNSDIVLYNKTRLLLDSHFYEFRKNKLYYNSLGYCYVVINDSGRNFDRLYINLKRNKEKQLKFRFSIHYETDGAGRSVMLDSDILLKSYYKHLNHIKLNGICCELNIIKLLYNFVKFCIIEKEQELTKEEIKDLTNIKQTINKLLQDEEKELGKKQVRIKRKVRYDNIY